MSLVGTRTMREENFDVVTLDGEVLIMEDFNEEEEVGDPHKTDQVRPTIVSISKPLYICKVGYNLKVLLHIFLEEDELFSLRNIGVPLIKRQVKTRGKFSQ